VGGGMWRRDEGGVVSARRRVPEEAREPLSDPEIVIERAADDRSTTGARVQPTATPTGPRGAPASTATGPRGHDPTAGATIEPVRPPEARKRAATLPPMSSRPSPALAPAVIVDTPPPRDDVPTRPTPPPPPGAPGYRSAAERAATPPTGVPSTMAGVRAPERAASAPRAREPSNPRPTMSSAAPPPPEGAPRPRGDS